MRVPVSDPSLLSDLCHYLSRRGCTALDASEDEADALIPGAPSSFEEATMLGRRGANASGLSITIAGDVSRARFAR